MLLETPVHVDRAAATEAYGSRVQLEVRQQLTISSAENTDLVDL